MTDKPENPQAFPQPSPGFIGMTLRDYFAAAALQGLMASEAWVVGMDKAAHKANADFKSYLAVEVYMMADAMLKARGE